MFSKFKRKSADIEKRFYISKILIDGKRYRSLRALYGVDQSSLFLIKDSLSEIKN